MKFLIELDSKADYDAAVEGVCQTYAYSGQLYDPDKRRMIKNPKSKEEFALEVIENWVLDFAKNQITRKATEEHMKMMPEPRKPRLKKRVIKGGSKR